MSQLLTDLFGALETAAAAETLIPGFNHNENGLTLETLAITRKTLSPFYRSRLVYLYTTGF